MDGTVRCVSLTHQRDVTNPKTSEVCLYGFNETNEAGLKKCRTKLPVASKTKNGKKRKHLTLLATHWRLKVRSDVQISKLWIL